MIQKLIVPDYYREFHSIWSSCPDTCCGGWKIPIDEKTMKKYRALGRSGFDFHGAVDRRRRQIVMKDGSCPLLEKGLCRLHRDLGEAYLPGIYGEGRKRGRGSGVPSSLCPAYEGEKTDALNVILPGKASRTPPGYDSRHVPRHAAGNQPGQR